MKKNLLLTLNLLLAQIIVQAQFPGPAGTAGSTAIYKDSSVFVAWGQTCNVERGYQDIADTSLGYTTTGDGTLATGPADGIQIVSLGDGGRATVSFSSPIRNGQGFDFAVFENGFIDEFLELAFVEVSSDGVNFFRFKATSNTQTDIQMGPFDYNADATLMNNLAGKYRALYGTPFDLEELKNEPGLNVDSISYVKVIDVVGSINPWYGSFDQNNNLINEHYPTPYPQGGFDLDAVGVIYNQVNGIKNNGYDELAVYPNPFTTQIYIIENAGVISSIRIIETSGNTVFYSSCVKSGTLELTPLSKGIYSCILTMKDGSLKYQKLVKVDE